MKKILLLIGLALPGLSFSQQGPLTGTFNKPVTCAPLEVILKGLASKDVNEHPLWIGRDETEKSDYVVFVNAKTKAFTLVQMGQEFGCILGIGYSSHLVEDKKL